MIREAIDNFQISPNLTETIMQEISRNKPTAPTSSKPFVPWTVAASTLAVILLMLGIGSLKHLTQVQKPYSLDATAEMTVDIIDTPIVANLEPTPDMRMQIKNANLLAKLNDPEAQQNDNIDTLSEDTQTEETMEDYTKWELPEKAKVRLGKGRIRAMQFAPDGTQLAVGTEIGVWLYDMHTGKEIALFPGRCESLAFSPDGRFLVNGGGNPYSMSGGSRWETGLQLWEVAKSQKVALHDPLPAASELWFSKDSKTLITLNKSGDNINWIDTETGKSDVKKIENRSDMDPRSHEFYALAHDKLAIANDKGMIALWNLKTGKKVSTLIGPEGRIKFSDLSIKLESISSLAFSPDGTYLAIGNTPEYLENTDKYLCLLHTSNNNEHIIFQDKSSSPEVLEFSPDGKILASGENDSVKLWDTATGESLDSFPGNINKVRNLALSPDSSKIAIASADGKIQFWNIRTGEPPQSHITRHIPWVMSTSFVNNSSTLACVDYSGMITIWDLETSKITTHETKTAYENTRYWIESSLYGFSPDGTKFLSDGVVNNPFAPLGVNSLIRLRDVSSGRELNTLSYSNEYLSGNVAFSPDGKTAAFGFHTDTYAKIRLWNTETDKTFDIQYSDGDDYLKRLTFSPDGIKLVAVTEKGKVQMWDARTGTELTTFLETHPPKAGFIRDMTFSSDGSLIAIVYQKQIRLIGLQKQPHFKEVSSDFKEVSSGNDVFWNRVVFSPDNTVLVLSLIFGGGIQLRDVVTGELLTTLEGHTAQPYVFSFSPDGKTLVSAGGDGSILLWDWDEVLKDLTGKDN